MKNLIIIAIAVLLASLSTCSTLRVNRNLDIKTNSKKVIIKGNNDAVNIHVYKDTLIIDSL